MVGQMKRRTARVVVTDHAVLGWLVAAHGLDVAAIRAMLAGRAQTGAELQAVHVVMGRVRLVLADAADAAEATVRVVAVGRMVSAGRARMTAQRRQWRDDDGD